eukprot:6183182-Pleurochrysis_carterae.AAC.3
MTDESETARSDPSCASKRRIGNASDPTFCMHGACILRVLEAHAAHACIARTCRTRSARERHLAFCDGRARAISCALLLRACTCV